MPTQRLQCPDGLDELLGTFIAEEATAAIRHDVRGKLASVRNGAFYIGRKLEGFPEVLQSDPRLSMFIAMIDSELDEVGNLLVSRLADPGPAVSEDVDPHQALVQLVESLQLPSGVSVTIADGTPRPIRANRAELQLAVFCLLQNAVEAAQALPERTVRLQVSPLPDRLLRIDFLDSRHSLDAKDTKPDRMGVGLKIARRIAVRWGGELLINPGQGVTAGLRFREIA